MIQIKDNGKTNFFFDEYIMLLERDTCWGDCGLGDSLWRTSLISLCDSDDKDLILSAIAANIRIRENGKISFIRHPKVEDNDDCSRDQSIMALITLKENRPNQYNNIVKSLSFRISKKFTWQDGFLWAKGKYTLWRVISFYRFFGLKWEPSYSVHLFCWMIWSSKERMRLFKWFLLKFIIPKENHLCRALLGVKEEIPELKPMIDLRWQRDYPWKEGRELTQEEAEYNCLDLEVLNFIVNSK